MPIIFNMQWNSLWLPKKDVLENMSWEDISRVCKAGVASEYWNLGDTKTIYIDGVALKVEIIGFYHDNVTDASAYGSKKAGITFQLQEAVYTSYTGQSGISDSCWGSLGDGWHESNIRDYLSSWILPELSEELRNCIVPVNKVSDESASDFINITTSDVLFILSAVEVFGQEAESDSSISKGHGSQYEFWSTVSSAEDRKKYYYSYKDRTLGADISSSARGWWLRSRKQNSTYYAKCVDNSGELGSKTVEDMYYCSFAFCI